MGGRHVIFFPMMAPGHMIPALDMAKMFASRRGVRSTIITTPLNVPVFSKSIDKSRKSGLQIDLHVLRFPAAEAGLPDGCESLNKITDDDMLPKFFVATAMLRDQLEQFLDDHRPDCLVADMFFPWTTDSASKFGIPRLVFHGMGYFALCASESVRIYKPFLNVKSEDEPFVVPNLPHEIKLTTLQLFPGSADPNSSDLLKMMELIKESETKSFGVIVNSFYELEPDYADHFRNFLKRSAWQVGPLSLCNREGEDKTDRGRQASINEDDCLKWLNSKNPDSVVYVCFGSVVKFTASQLHELAMGLEASGQPFIWAVREDIVVAGEDEGDWLPEGFEERTKGRGLIIRGWAPQVLILDHETVGGFMTHCGWNSTLEGVTAGQPMVTCPFFAEQFFNEKLVTDVLRIGVGVGTKKWCRMVSEGLTKEGVEKAVRRVMVGKEAEEMRNRARSLKVFAKKAVEEGGSSYSSLDALIAELGSNSNKTESH